MAATATAAAAAKMPVSPPRLSDHIPWSSMGSESKLSHEDTLSQRYVSPGSDTRKPVRVEETSPRSSISVKTILTKAMAWNATGFAFSTIKKWRILVVIFLVQISMNWNAAIYGSVVLGVREEFGLSILRAMLGGALFLICYAFGCELWAPFSEEFGRKWVLQGSLFLVNMSMLGCALAPNHAALCFFRVMGGFSSAGGSVTLGMVADMWEPDQHQYALSFVVLSSVAGSAFAPVFGGLLQTYTTWRIIMWTSFGLGLLTQALHLVLVPETRLSCLLDRAARELRRLDANVNVWGPGELRGSLWSRLRKEPRATAREIGVLMWRPYHMLLTEPIVGLLSLLSGFSDMLVFVGLSSYPLILSTYYEFSVVGTGLAFIALLVGYFAAYLFYLVVYHFDRKQLRRDPGSFEPEQRLYHLNYLVWGMPVGLILFAFVPLFNCHWIVPLICLFVIGVANYAIYGATIDYMVAAYGEYSASATGGNGFARDFLAGTAMLWATPFYKMTPNLPKEWMFVTPTAVLAVMGALLCIPVIVFWSQGAKIRARSPMASAVMAEAVIELEERSAPPPAQGSDAV